MNNQEAIKIIYQAINAGFKAGVYTLDDAKHIVDALNIINQEVSSEKK